MNDCLSGNRNVERIRNLYRPIPVKILFVGESAPANGDFFYFGGCGFTAHTRKAFECVLDVKFHSEKVFLSAFRKYGCWLDDISHDPVDRLERRERNGALQGCIAGFADRLAVASPKVVIVMLRRIEGYVDEAIKQSNIHPVVHRLPFPGNGHQTRYVEGLIPVLRDVLDCNHNVQPNV